MKKYTILFGASLIGSIIFLCCLCLIAELTLQIKINPKPVTQTVSVIFTNTPFSNMITNTPNMATHKSIVKTKVAIKTATANMSSTPVIVSPTPTLDK